MFTRKQKKHIINEIFPIVLIQPGAFHAAANVASSIVEYTTISNVEHDETRVYKNTPWTEWLQMQTYYTNLLDTYPKKYPDGTKKDVPLLTYYNLVRNYSYEWVAYGVEGMNL